VNFEPGGKDHASPGSSYDVGKHLAKQIYDITPPVFKGYEFIGIRGLTGKMSGSSGLNISLANLLEVYEPSLLRWIFTKIKPEQAFNLAFDEEIIRQYEEYDKMVQRYGKDKISPQDRDTLLLSMTNGSMDASQNPMPFRQAIGHGQSTHFQVDKLEKLLDELGTNYDSTNTQLRLRKAENWLKYNSDKVVKLNSQRDQEFYDALTPQEQHQIVQLKDLIVSSPELPIKDLERELYQIPKSDQNTQSENKQQVKRFFQNTYQLLLGVDTGPRLPLYIWAADKKEVINLIKF